MDPVVARDWELAFPLDVRRILSVQGRGRGDPTYRLDAAGAIWRTSLTPLGPATLRVTSEATAVGGTRILARAWGPGTAWILDALPGCLGLDDDVSGFDPGDHPLIRDSARRNPGLRIGHSGRLLEALVPAILEQKVVILEAHRAWKILLWKHGTPPPGPAPAGMRVFPAPSVWRRIPSWDWHRAGVEGVRAETIIRAVTVAGSLERLTEASHADADRKLRTINGIGVWTSAEARQRACGDPDAVSVGDAHLSNIVGFALAGRDRTDDAGMLELLKPYAGQRYRVTRLIGLSTVRTPGVIPRRNAGGPPRRGPRMPVRDYRSF
ncbi:MAG TPA: DNA-3-methyladenine glycosylase 2 family protein [Trebonia sp.]|nr:DNA-3-methyladenine glycosylase 2 family protein [Trebonia sp.]